VTLTFALQFLAAFGAGLLAGIEVAVRFGVRGPLAALDQQPHLRMRQGLIRTLRLLVPSVFVPTLLLGAVATILAGTATGAVFRWLAVAALLVWTATTFAGTVPINQAVAEWDPAMPPQDWRAVIKRWQTLDTVRTWAALLASASFLTAIALQLA
jgi:uncharacterized membrane protein